MPAGLTDSDSMFSVRETPWHGLGAVLERPPATVAEAIEASGLGWRVEKEPIAIDRGDVACSEEQAPHCEQIPGYYATVRQDTRDPLGIVGERYRIVQNEEAFAFIDQLLGSAINFETGGNLHGGRRVWVLATLPSHVEVGGDDVRPYVLLMNSHDGSTAVIAATTPDRRGNWRNADICFAEIGLVRLGSWVYPGVVVSRRSPQGERRETTSAQSATLGLLGVRVWLEC